MDTIVQVEGLRKTYGKTVAVDDVSFDVRQGEIFGMVGPNGAGKTTTIECLEGLRKPDRGTVRVLGMDPQRESQVLREHTGMQLQQSNLPDRMKVWEALDLYASFYPKARTGRNCCSNWGWMKSAIPPSPIYPAGKSSACSSPWRSCPTPNWSSWTNSPPASTHRRGSHLGPGPRSARRARPSC